MKKVEDVKNVKITLCTFLRARSSLSKIRNPAINTEIEPQQKRKRPWKKVKLGGSDPTFSAFSRPSEAWVAPALRHTSRV